MANSCLVVLEWTFGSDEEAAKFADDLTRRIDDAWPGGVDIGCAERLLGEAEVSRSGSVVTASGYTRWDLHAAAMLAIARASAPATMRAWFEERGDLLYGRYEWDGSKMRCWQLQNSDWPNAPDTGDIGENWCAMSTLLQSALDRCPMTWEATPEQIEEDERAYQEARAAAWKGWKRVSREDESCSQSHT